jgi:MFS family permease
MGIYIIFLYCGNSVGSLVAGFIIEGAGWRWFSWFCAIISGLNFLAIFIFVHETRFNRIPSETASIHESGSSDKGFLPEQVEKVNSTASSAELTGTKKTLLQSLSLWSGVSKESYLSHFLRPFLLIVYPAVVWGILACKSSSECT